MALPCKNVTWKIYYVLYMSVAAEAFRRGASNSHLGL